MSIISALSLLNFILFGIIAVLLLFIKEEKTKKEKSASLAHMKEDFTNMMVHELRAPLTSIKDASELITSTTLRLNKDEQRKLAKIIHQQSKVLLDQVGSILDAAKIDAGKLTIKKAPGDIAHIIKERIRIFLPQASKKRISMAIDIPEHLPMISFDPIRIAQVLNNLLSNSLKFTKEGGKITVKATLAKHLLTVSVSDTGIGIPKEDQERIFSKFHQASTTPQQLAKEGTGLGLYVVKKIVEAHGGTIGMESVPDKGTIISFTLPVLTELQKIPSQKPPEPATPNFVSA